MNKTGNNLRISIVVPVRNEEEFLGSTLSRLLGQDYPVDRFEILVVDGRSDDGTRDVVRDFQDKHSNLRLLDNPRRWSSVGRNIGVRESDGDIVLIVDGHCELQHADYLSRLSEAFDRTCVDCIGRPQPLNVSGATTLQHAIATARASWLGHHPDSFIYAKQEQIVPAKSVGVAYRRDVFDRIGYFDESFDACEDVEFNHRLDQAGMSCLLLPSVAVHYHPRRDLRSLFYQLARYGRGRVRLLRKHPDTFSLKSFVPALFVAGVVLGPLTFFASSTLTAAYWFCIGLYAVIVAGMSLLLGLRHRHKQVLFWLPVVYLTIHMSSGIGILREFITRARPRSGTANAGT